VLQLPLWLGWLVVPWWCRRQGLDWRRDLGWAMRVRDIPIGLAIGVALQLIVIPLLYLPLFEIFGDRDVGEAARAVVGTADGWFDVVALVVMVVIGAPLAEEVFFRGLLHRAVADQLTAGSTNRSVRAGRAGAVLISSVIFAAIHLQVLQFPALLVVGIVMAVLVEVSGRLGPAIWAHVGFNATTVAVLLAT